ncbi:MazG family protein [Lipingzhangella sp. LS1_29]|uniref:MazG family protein n=1 Tax=Lipingzhangella rawalii TaxID=2055835 RepID=A0ABU2H3A0_9ACTN|nr:MazG family protein [Lipingzhangella rawalii]MDS1269774.1 MazG family protein [Lipingzhangella rawalii]
MSAQPEPGRGVQRLVEVMDTLRRECPWDAEQTHESLARFLIEEAYEAVETIETGRLDQLCGELGDVLLQVVFHARVSQENQDTAFDLDDVATAVADKLVRRHPHVFADTRVDGVGDVRANWETIKATERADSGAEDTSVVAGVPFGQPAALLAYALQKRAVRNGVPEDLLVEDTAEPGSALFAAVAEQRRAGADPEQDLRSAARRFDARLRAAEAAAQADGLDPRELSPEQWRKYWDTPTR